MKKYYLALLFIFGSSWLFAESLDSKNDNILTIDMALEKAIASNSAFLAVSKQKEISNSLLRQARQKPSPELKIGVDDYAGSGVYKKTSSMKSIIGLTQTIEMGNKRKKRISSAKASGELELVKIDIAKKELKLKVISAYFELFRLTKELEMQNEATILAKETADTVNKKVAVGELPQIDATRVNVEFSREEAVKKHLELDVVSAKNELASFWNSKTFDYDSIDLVCDSFIKQEFKNPSEELINALPEVRLADSQIKLAQADIRKAKAEANADIDFSVTYNKFRESSEHAWGIEASFPLKGRSESGNISAAKHTFEANKLEKEGIISEISVKIANAFREKESLQKEVTNIETALIPAAKQAYQETKIAFESGEKSLLDLFDARKTMLETSKLYLEIQCRYFNAIGEYAVLTDQY